MAQDKYSALWISYSSLSDFQRCPRMYFLKNIYKDPKTGHKVQIASPGLSLGHAVHEVVESLSVLPVEKRFEQSLIDKFEAVWKKVTGKKGGFTSDEIEREYKVRGIEMLGKIQKNPGPLSRLAVKIKMDLPHYWISDDDNIILCGKIDWLEYLKESESVHIIDFKSGKGDEKEDSWQLPIYFLIATHTQSRPVVKTSYWYIERNDELTPVPLPDAQEYTDEILKVARKIKTAKALNRLSCPQVTGCNFCRPYESILRGEGELVGVDSYDKDVYLIGSEALTQEESSVVL